MMGGWLGGVEKNKRSASPSLAWSCPQYAISDGTFALALAGSDGGSAETGVWGYCLRYWVGVRLCTCLKRREK